MHDEFVDDRLNSDMTDIRHIMQKVGTNPVFKLEFRRNSANDIVMCISSESTTMPSTIKIIKSVNQISQEFMEYVAETANWV